MRADLHVHTTASDGSLTPREVVRLAGDLGIDVIAITDHDCVDGIPAALQEAERFPSVRVVPGVEMGTDVHGNEVHVLGYFVDHTAADFTSTLKRLRDSRVVRAKKMVDKLNEMGLGIPWQRVERMAGSGAVGRPHIAEVMLEEGHISSYREAFSNYIGRNGPAYVEREKLTPVEVVELLCQAKGLPVLGHPADIAGLEELISALQRVGLVGLEVYYAGYSQKVVQYLASVARKHGLVATGGSDYHGRDTANETPMGGVRVPPECVDQLFALSARRSLAR